MTFPLAACPPRPLTNCFRVRKMRSLRVEGAFSWKIPPRSSDPLTLGWDAFSWGNMNSGVGTLSSLSLLLIPLQRVKTTLILGSLRFELLAHLAAQLSSFMSQIHRQPSVKGPKRQEYQ